MAVLKITDRGAGAQHAAEVARNSPRPLTLSELFLSGPGAKARFLLTSDTDQGAPWHTVLMPLVNVCAQLLWPRCAVSTFQVGFPIIRHILFTLRFHELCFSQLAFNTTCF
jgi:hypothetical protein